MSNEYNEATKENLNDKVLSMKMTKFYDIANIDSVDRARDCCIIRKINYLDNDGVRVAYEKATNEVLLNMRLSDFHKLLDKGLDMPMKDYAGEPLSVTDSFNARQKILAEFEFLISKVTNVMFENLPDPSWHFRRGSLIL